MMAIMTVDIRGSAKPIYITTGHEGQRPPVKGEEPMHIIFDCNAQISLRDICRSIYSKRRPFPLSTHHKPSRTYDREPLSIQNCIEALNIWTSMSLHETSLLDNSGRLAKLPRGEQHDSGKPPPPQQILPLTVTFAHDATTMTSTFTYWSFPSTIAVPVQATVFHGVHLKPLCGPNPCDLTVLTAPATYAAPIPTPAPAPNANTDHSDTASTSTKISATNEASNTAGSAIALSSSDASITASASVDTNSPSSYPLYGGATTGPSTSSFYSQGSSIPTAINSDGDPSSVLTSETASSSTGITPNRPNRQDHSSNVTKVLGGVIGGVLFLLIILTVIFVAWRRKRRRRSGSGSIEATMKQKLPIITPYRYIPMHSSSRDAVDDAEAQIQPSTEGLMSSSSSFVTDSSDTTTVRSVESKRRIALARVNMLVQALQFQQRPVS